MKKIILFGIVIANFVFVGCSKHKEKVPFVGDYNVKMDLSYVDSTSAYMQMYVVLSAMVDSGNSGDLIPYRISFDDTVLRSYYSDNQTFSYSYTYQKMGKDYYLLVLDQRDTIDLEVRDTDMLMIFPDNMAFLLTKEKNKSCS